MDELKMTDAKVRIALHYGVSRPASPQPRPSPEEWILNRSLSVLLPVHNVQGSLAARIEEILEVLPELTDRFELIMTDHGSTDGTWEVARDLMRQYPQIRLLREPARSGKISAIRPRLDAARGDVVIAHDGGAGIDVRAIARLWRSANSACP